MRNKNWISGSRNSNCDWEQSLRILPQESKYKCWTELWFLPPEILPFDGVGPCPVRSWSLLVIASAWAMCQYNMRVKLTAASYCDLVSTYDKQGVGTNGLCVKLLLFLLTGADFSFKEREFTSITTTTGEDTRYLHPPYTFLPLLGTSIWGTPYLQILINMV